MQAKLISPSLREFALLFEAAKCDDAASHFHDFAALFQEFGTKSVAVVAKKILQHWTSTHPAAYPASLKSQLKHAVAILEASKAAKSVIADYQIILGLFKGEDTASAQTFFADLRHAFNAPVPKAKSKARAAKVIDPIEIRAISDKLTGLLNDNAGFDVAVAEIAAPRKFSNKELIAIAEQFLGYKGSHKTKAAIIKAIKVRQMQDAIQSSKDRRIEKIAV